MLLDTGPLALLAVVDDLLSVLNIVDSRHTAGVLQFLLEDWQVVAECISLVQAPLDELVLAGLLALERVYLRELLVRHSLEHLLRDGAPGLGRRLLFPHSSSG